MYLSPYQSQWGNVAAIATNTLVLAGVALFRQAVQPYDWRK